MPETGRKGAGQRRASRATLVLLGPQRLEPTASETLSALIADGAPVAAVTAGWEEREAELRELRADLGREVESLGLHRRAESVFASDPELHAALKQRHSDLRDLHALYRLRLRHVAEAAAALLERDGPDALLEPEREDALESLRALDAHHLDRVTAIHGTFLETWRPTERAAIAREREEIAAILEQSAALLIAGGHVRILHTRLWLFDVAGLLPGNMPVVAWSAGAMALAERIVLFHDNPPQGRGYAEVLGPGLGLAPGIVPLPHATRRLALEDEVRVQLLSRRFPDALCVALDEGSRIDYDGDSWSAPEATRVLTPAGRLAPVGGA